jgi:hypothetical protein
MSTNDPQGVPTLGTISPLAERENLCAALRLLPPGCTTFVAENEAAFLSAPGSGHNHQFWVGGYADHLDELCAIASVTYEAWSSLRPLPFSLEDALLVLFLHDVEKCFKRLSPDTPRHARYEAASGDQHRLQDMVAKGYEIALSTEQENALIYVHGELDGYSKTERVMSPLAAFVHACDYWSARGWHDQPLASGRLPRVLDA